MSFYIEHVRVKGARKRTENLTLTDSFFRNLCCQAFLGAAPLLGHRKSSCSKSTMKWNMVGRCPWQRRALISKDGCNTWVIPMFHLHLELWISTISRTSLSEVTSIKVTWNQFENMRHCSDLVSFTYDVRRVQLHTSPLRSPHIEPLGSLPPITVSLDYQRWNLATQMRMGGVSYLGWIPKLSLFSLFPASFIRMVQKQSQTSRSDNNSIVH